MKVLFIVMVLATIPFLYFLLMSIFKDIVKVRGIRKYKKAKRIDHNNYEELELNEVNTNYVLPVGQIAYFTFEVPDVQIAVKQKKYTGNTKTGIKMPFFRMSLQDRELYDTYSFMNWGHCYVTLTNKKLKIMSYGSEPARKEMTIGAVEHVILTDDDRTVFVSLSENVYPVKIKLNSAQEAIDFQNALWTLRFKKNIKREKNNKAIVYHGDPMSDEPNKDLKKCSKAELLAIALELSDDETIKKYKKNELLEFIENGVRPK